MSGPDDFIEAWADQWAADAFATPASAGDHAHRLREEGLTLFPLGAGEPPAWFVRDKCDGDADDARKKWPKTPRVAWTEYQQRAPTEDEVARWESQFPGANWAVVTGADVVVVDADTPQAVAWTEGGSSTGTPRRVKTAKGWHYYFRGDTSIRNSQERLSIDIRGQGGYVVAPGSVHSTGEIYVEHNPTGDLCCDLPRLTERDLQAIEGFRRAQKAAAGGPQSAAGTGQRFGEGAPEGERNGTLAANVGPWINEGRAVDEIHRLAVELNERNTPPLPVGEVVTTVASVIRTHIKRNADERGGPPPLSGAQHNGNPENEKRDAVPAPTPLVLPDPRSIPRRRFVGGNKAYPRGVAVSVLGAGGTAKTTLLIAEAIGLTTGRHVLHAPPGRPATVWLVNLEDPLVEEHRKIAAFCTHFGIEPHEYEGRLFVDSGMDTPMGITTATTTRHGTVIHAPVFAALERHMRAHSIDVLVVDPFVSTHRIVENDNGAMDDVVKEWSKLANRTNACVVLVHHLRKLGGREATSEDARGGVALIAGVRLARVINPMTKDEAEKAGIVDDAWRHFRTTNGKANLTPRSDRSTWYRLESVTLPNDQAADDECEDGGDSVGVVTPWRWPDSFDGVGVADLKRVQARLIGGEWRKDPRATAWVGRLVGEVLGIDVADKGGRAQVATIVKTWFESGALRTEKRIDANKTKRDFVVPGAPPDALFGPAAVELQ